MKKIIFILAIMCFLKITAQNSLKTQQNQQHFYYESLLQNFHNQPFLFYIYPVNNYTNTTLSYQNQQNNTAKEQQANSVTNISLNAEGIFKYKNALFSGNISYTRNNLKDLGWNTTNLHPYKNSVELSPIYNLAYQSGNWNNQFYKINGNLVLPILKNKLFTSININYKTLQFFRTEFDPKPKLTYLDVLGNINLYYKLSPKSYLGIMGSYGKVNNRITVDYTARGDVTNIPSNTELYYRISYGYGIIESALNSKRTSAENDEKYSGAIKYIFNSNKHLINTNITYSNDKTNFNIIESSNKDVLLAKYTVNKLSAKANWYNFTNGHSFNINGNYTTGSNFRITTNGKNYDASLINANATYQILKKQTDNFIKHNYGFTANMYKLNKKDYQAVNSFEFTNVGLGGFYGKDFKAGNNKVYVKTSASMLINLNKLKYFSNTNSRFITDVALPDFYINTANKLNTMFQVGYQQKIKLATYFNVGAKFEQRFFLNLNNSIATKGFNYGGILYFSIVY